MKKYIKKKLQHYKIPINEPDVSLPLKYEGNKKVAVIGGGLAGISAAHNLSEKGFKVVLFEKASFLGGKVGSWQFESNGETLRTEHGFHAFFRQYYNLLAYMERIGAAKNLIPIDDYVILFNKNEKQGFKNIETTPGLNILNLKKYGIFNWLTLISPFSMPFLNLLTYNKSKTFKKFDDENFAQFAKRTFMPQKMRLVFNSFARAFFAEPHNMSMAELIKGFHFYFLSNDKGLLYDVLDSDFQYSFIDNCISELEKNGVDIRLNNGVDSFDYQDDKFVVNQEFFDYCVMCADVNTSKNLITKAKGLQPYANLQKSFGHLQNSGHYAVLRLWTNAFEEDKNWPYFVFTDRLECLDSVTFYHKMEKESAAWSKENKGGIFELHCYAVPENMNADACKKQLLDEFIHYFPELKDMEIKHEYYQFRNDFPAFHAGLHELRPTIKSEVPNLFFAGDWVKMDNATMLMEAAYTSGALAANEILKIEQVQEHALYQVPDKGLFA